jgi:hypothetical protein
MKIKMDKIYRATHRKDGTQLVGKNGKPYTLVNIISGDKRYTYFDSFNDSALWSEGTESPDMDVEEGNYNGQVQYTLRKPNKIALLETRVKALEERMDQASRIVSDLVSNPKKPW